MENVVNLKKNHVITISHYFPSPEMMIMNNVPCNGLQRPSSHGRAGIIALASTNKHVLMSAQSGSVKHRLGILVLSTKDMRSCTLLTVKYWRNKILINIQVFDICFSTLDKCDVLLFIYIQWNKYNIKSNKWIAFQIWAYKKILSILSEIHHHD